MRRRYWRILLTQLHIVTHIFFFDILMGSWFRASTTRRWTIAWFMDSSYN